MTNRKQGWLPELITLCTRKRVLSMAGERPLPSQLRSCFTRVQKGVKTRCRRISLRTMAPYVCRHPHHRHIEKSPHGQFIHNSA